MNNIQITKDILFRHIKGSFILVIDRVPDENESVDFLSDMRVAMYHFLIVHESSKKEQFSFPDILETFNYDPYDTHFTDIDDKYPDGDYYVSENKLKKITIQQAVDTYLKIVTGENNSNAILYLKDDIYGKVAGYKFHVMKGQAVPVYRASVVGKKIVSLDCVFGHDILKQQNTTDPFIKFFERAL